METKKIKILFYNSNRSAGINYYRTLTPAMELERVVGDKFHIEILNSLDFNDNIVEKLKKYDIIHYHNQLHPDINKMGLLSAQLREHNVKLIMDIDDYWHLDKTHSLFETSVKQKYALKVIFNLKNADYVTTTSEHFANEIRSITEKDNVIVFENAVNPSWMKQFENNKVESDLVRIGYLGGSTHKRDVELLRGVVNMLQADSETRNKFKIVLAGWNNSGKKKEVIFNKELGDKLLQLNLWDEKMVKDINSSRGDINKVPRMPEEFKRMYEGTMFILREVDADSKDSPYWFYEQILTDNHNLIQDDDYKRWLLTFEENNIYHNEKYFSRVWTQKANSYAKVLDGIDIVLAPLETTKYNTFKSNLKQVECWTRKLPIVCSDVVPYNVYGVDNHNCMLVENKKNSAKHWKKKLKELILDPEKRRVIGENLYNDFSEKFNLELVTKRRAEFYGKL